MSDETQATLPGLELIEHHGSSTFMQESVTMTVEALTEDGLLHARHMGLVATAMSLAIVLDDPRRAGRASGVANAASVLADILANKLPQPSASTAADKFAEFVRKLEAAAEAGKVVDDALRQ